MTGPTAVADPEEPRRDTPRDHAQLTRSMRLTFAGIELTDAIRAARSATWAERPNPFRRVRLSCYSCGFVLAHCVCLAIKLRQRGSS